MLGTFESYTLRVQIHYCTNKITVNKIKELKVRRILFYVPY